MRRLLRGLLWVAGLLALAALILRLTVLDVWTVPDDPVLGASVAPTMAPGDVVLLLTRGSAGFGDLVRCKDPDDPQRFVIGRVAGVEGDIVETEGKNLTVNGKRYDSESACTTATVTVAHPTSGAATELHCDVVEMGGGWHYRGSVPRPFLSTTKRVEVGTGMIYLLSDNREHHDDSRDFGQIPRTACPDRVFFRALGRAGWSDEQARLTYIH
jgi:signal peptidase I